MLEKHSRLTSNSSSSFVLSVVQNIDAKSFTHFYTKSHTFHSRKKNK
jgi:hypothetical protein